VDWRETISPNELTGLCLYYCMKTITSQWHWQTPKSWTMVGLKTATYDSRLDEIRIRCIMEVGLSLQCRPTILHAVLHHRWFEAIQYIMQKRTASQHLRGHVTSSVTWPFDSPYAISYWWSFGTKPLSLTVSEIFNVKCSAMVDMTLIRPLNGGQGHSFWSQSISHIAYDYLCCQ